MVASAEQVLVVEDDVELAELFAAWLEERYAVETAYSGPEALEAFDDDVDVVLLDRLMPDVSGEEVLAAIRERDDACLVIMVTAVEPDFDIVELGFDSYLTKPVTPEELHGAIETVLERRDFDEKHRTYFRLLARRAVLVGEKSRDELAASEEFQGLTERIEAVEDEVEDTLEEFEDEDFHAMFRAL